MNRLSMGKWRVSFFFRLIAALSVLFAVSSSSRAQIAVTVAFAPPELPVYEQPLCPAEDYIWVPGYWAWDGDDYFWVPGTWAMAPEVGFFWTPGYWGWGGGGYAWYPGYWGPTVGFYGGIVDGFGYFGHGYEGGRWDHGHFFYNRTVNNVNVTVIHNVYNTTIENRNVNVTRVSYNGGNGGVNARPTREEEAVVHERHVAMTSAQTQHFDAARQNRELRASVNQGKPPIAASVRPGEFHGQSVVAAREGGRYTPPPNRGNAGQPGGGSNVRPAIHPNDLPPFERPPSTNATATKEEQKYQQQQEKMYQKQEQERQKLQQQQDREHQQEEKRQTDQPSRQQMEQRHQQQTQAMQDRQVQQQHQMEQRAPAPAHQAPPPHH